MSIWRAECEPQGEQTAFVQSSKLDFHCCIELLIAQPAGTSQQVKGSSKIPWKDLTYTSVGWGSVGSMDCSQSTSTAVTWVISGAAPLHSQSGSCFSCCPWPASPDGVQRVAEVPSSSSRFLSGSVSLAPSRWHQLLTAEQTKLLYAARKFRKEAVNKR